MESKEKLGELSPEDLEKLFVMDNIRTGRSSTLLSYYGGLRGLESKLGTNLYYGVSSRQIPYLLTEFGSNYPYVRQRKGFLHFAAECLKDTVLQILIVAAMISLVVGLIQEPKTGWLEGVAILSAVVIVVLVTALNDSMKEKQFIKLNAEVDTHKVIVTRDSVQHEISAKELVVGDLMSISPGEIFPADGVLIKGNLVVDESALTGESKLLKKQKEDFLVSGAKVVEGNAWMLVAAVGKFSFQGKQKQLTEHLEQEQGTPLQETLEKTAEGLGKIGFLAGTVLSLVLISHVLFDALVEMNWSSGKTSEVVSALILGITVLVVAIPEGLPLALTLAMAYSVFRMKDEKIFVRHIRGCEVMGAATNICSDKTGTLTENKMRVTKCSFFGTDNLNLQHKDFIAECISRNTSAFLSESELIGNRTDCAMLLLLEDWNKNYESYRDESLQVAQFPFSSNKKRMTTVYQFEDEVEVYCKGAAEIVLELCNYISLPDFSCETLTEDLKQDIKCQINDLGSEGLRVLGIAHRVFNSSKPEELEQENFEKDLVFLGFVGIEDPVRSEAKESVTRAQNSGVVVRMITGDSLETAVKVAKESGIVPSDLLEEELKTYIMEGSEFREKTLGLVTIQDDDGKVSGFEVGDLKNFKSIQENLRVIARCSPEDKLILVTGLKQLGEVVGVTGDGSNDAAALKQSDIGLAMMSGTPLAKESSDIILLDDNFMSVLNSVKWGRNVYSCIRKFLQFQMTVNGVALAVSIAGALTVEASPLNAVQMLWVNLIMDSLAALALATEPPTDELLKTKPHGRNEPIINSEMCVTMLSQAFYQLAVLMVLLYFGPTMLQIEQSYGQTTWTESNGKHFTILFHTFVMLQLFNEVNCRKLSLKEWNLFKGFFDNWMFLTILVVTLVIQLLLVQFGGKAVGCSPLSFEEHFLCVGLGSVTLLVALLVRALAPLKAKYFSNSLEEAPLLVTN